MFIPIRFLDLHNAQNLYKGQANRSAVGIIEFMDKSIVIAHGEKYCGIPAKIWIGDQYIDVRVHNDEEGCVIFMGGNNVRLEVLED